MSDQNLKINVSANTQAAVSGLKDLSSSLGGLLSVAGTVAAAVGAALTGFFESCIKEAEQAEKSTIRFKNTLDVLGKSASFDRLTEQADQLAKSFGFLDNDDVVDVFDKLATFGKLTELQIGNLTPVIVDFAAKSGQSLDSATNTILRALEGQGRGLKQYGIDLQKGASVTENFGVIMTQLADKVKGAGDAFGETFAGKVQTAQQKIKDLEEEIGNELLPSLTNIKVVGLEAFAGIIQGVEQAGNLFKNTFRLIFDHKDFIHDEDLAKAAQLDKAAKDFAASFVKAIPDQSVKGLEKELVAQQALLKGDKDRAFEASKAFTLGQGLPGISNDEIKQSQAIVDALKQQVALAGEKNKLADVKKPEKDTSLADINKEIAALEELDKKGIATRADISKLFQLRIEKVDIQLPTSGFTTQQADALKGKLEDEANARFQISPLEFKIDKPLVRITNFNVLGDDVFKDLQGKVVTIPPGTITIDVTKALGDSLKNKTTGDLSIAPSIKIDYNDADERESLRKQVNDILKKVGSNIDDATNAQVLKAVIKVDPTLEPLEAQDIANKLQLENFTKGLSVLVKDGIVNSLSGIGEAIGAAIGSGNFDFSSITNAFAAGLGDSLISIGKYVISYSIKIAAIQKVLDTLLHAPGGAVIAIGLGIAAIALGAALKSAVSKSSAKFAGGGIVTGPTNALIGEAGPEVVFPLNQINKFINGVSGGGNQQIAFEPINTVVRGSDIFISQQAYIKRSNRLG